MDCVAVHSLARRRRVALWLSFAGTWRFFCVRMRAASVHYSKNLCVCVCVCRRRHDYTPEQHIAHVIVVPHALSPEDGTLTRTMKMRRTQVVDKYSKQVDTLLHQLRG